MKRLLSILFIITCATYMHAQKVSNATFLRAQQKADVVVPYRYTDTGKATPLEWGVDVGWISEDNVRTSVMFAGKDLIDIVRTSYRPTESVEDGALSESQLSYVKDRSAIVNKWLKKGVQVNINDDPGDGSSTGVAAWYNALSADSTGRGQRWAKCIDLHYDAFKAQGLTNIVSISPFNEPDYGWGQGYSSETRQADMKAVCKSLKEDFNGKYDGVRICGGNTLNDDCAYDWWNYMKDYLDEGNTHQLAGDFDHYANFFTTVRDAGMHATADELHNTMEAMVGVEYGLQTGIWWGSAEYTRSQFMKATYKDNPGQRLGYAEHRSNWTAASVYRLPDGRVQGFGGTSERQAAATTYNFLALDRPVWYDGMRSHEYTMSLPGGTGYQVGQTNAETLVNIQSGEDVMPALTDTIYKIMNVNSGLIMGYNSTPAANSWSTLQQRKNSNTTKSLQWILVPTEKSGDMYYYTLRLNVTNKFYLDIKDWNYNDGADVGVYQGGLGTNEQWYLEPAGNNAFYIRSRFSTKCLEVVDGKTTAAANIQMGEYNGEKYQQWRFIPVKVTPDLVAPAAPTAFSATPGNASIDLTWTAPADKDIKSYTIMRSDGENSSDFYTLCNNITGTTFTDNEAVYGQTYTYKVVAEDNSLNRSEASETVTSTTTGEKGLVMQLALDSTLYDSSDNANHAAFYGTPTYATRKNYNGLNFNGSANYVQLPYTIASSDEMSISIWVYYMGGNSWQRIFDFGNGTDQYMFLTPQYGSGLSFAIKNGGDEQLLRPGKTLTTSTWHHLVITLGSNGGVMYLDGKQIAQNTAINIKPSDINPVCNYLGRSQFTADPLFKGYLRDVRIYNYALTADEVAAIKDEADAIQSISDDSSNKANNTVTYDLSGRRTTISQKGIVIRNGKKMMR